MKSVAIVITVFNRKKDTLQCLKNIENQSITLDNQYNVDVYLTNDGCTDGTPEAIREHFPYVNIIEGDGFLFWNRGMYVAWQEASKGDYDFYLWLNDDTQLYKETLIKLIETSSIFNDKAIILGTTCDKATKSIITYGGKTIEGEYAYSSDKPSKCMFMNGNIVLIPRYVFRVVGYNDPYYSHAMGDYDYGLMAVKKNIEIYTAPGFSGECDLHKNISTWKDPEKTLSQRWKALFKPTGANPFEYFYYRRKHFGIIAACKTFISNFAHVLFPQFWNPDKR